MHKRNLYPLFDARISSEGVEPKANFLSVCLHGGPCVKSAFVKKKLNTGPLLAIPLVQHDGGCTGEPKPMGFAPKDGSFP